MWSNAHARSYGRHHEGNLVSNIKVLRHTQSSVRSASVEFGKAPHAREKFLLQNEDVKEATQQTHERHTDLPDSTSSRVWTEG